MSEQTKIAWCDSTVNFWSGCTKVSDGCAHCYAETLSNRFQVTGIQDPDAPDTFAKSSAFGGWGKGQPRVRHEGAFKAARRYNRKPWICDECGHASASDSKRADLCHCDAPRHRRRIFSLSLGDWLDYEVPIEWLAEMLDTVRQCDQVTWILCSKRWENWLSRIQEAFRLQNIGSPTFEWLSGWLNGKAPSNIIGLCSVENQEMADQRIPQFLTVPLACRGLSLEPLLGPVDVQAAINKMPFTIGGNRDAGLHWLIVGGESGPNARPCNVDWIRSLVKQGVAAGVKVFVKQMGAAPYFEPDGFRHEICYRDKKGGDPSEWPADLRVQQWPKGEAQ